MKYNVVFAMSYTIESDNEQDAEEQASILFKEDTGIDDSSMFGINTEPKV